ncbi:MAG: hypothetical protein FWC17_05510 [Treponema sp.]|nr:hypothetical protein [Treponema sp.]
MDTLDSTFTSPTDCYLALFQDALFEHNGNTYIFENNQFKRRDIDEVVKKIANMADNFYSKMANKKASFKKCSPRIDYNALRGVVLRYSRDIYGFRRIKAKLENLENITGINSDLKDEIEQIVSESGHFGFLIPSSSPYLHRQASVLLYWFSVLKPFHLDRNGNDGLFPEAYIIAFYNEYFAYSLINIALHSQSSEMVLHTNEEFFKSEFLYQLHFRNLSRSSLEFFLPSWIKTITSKSKK